MNKIKLISKETIKTYTKEQKELITNDIIRVIGEQYKTLTAIEIKRLFKNIYNLGIYRFIELDRTYKILSTGHLKELSQ